MNEIASKTFASQFLATSALMTDPFQRLVVAIKNSTIPYYQIASICWLQPIPKSSSTRMRTVKICCSTPYTKNAPSPCSTCSEQDSPTISWTPSTRTSSTSAHTQAATSASTPSTHSSNSPTSSSSTRSSSMSSPTATTNAQMPKRVSSSMRPHPKGWRYSPKCRKN